jgi:hypothetical protein
MASDNNATSFLLLILIGIAIYYLLYTDNFNSLNKLITNKTKTNENFVEMIEQSNTNIELPYSQQPITQSQTEPSNINYEPYVSQSVINDVAAVNNPTEQIVDNQQPSLNTNDIYTFQPNDAGDLGIYGSNLNDAFALPLPNDVSSDTIDFKKQNVDNYNARDFLPKEINDEWFETDFSLAKYQLNDDKLINTEKYIIGINTVGQSLKNASWDIRGTVACPKLVVSPWNNSTYEPDFNLKPLC